MRAYALTGSDQLVFTGVGWYGGFSVRETAAAAASIRVYDGTSATGTLLDTIALAANESARENYTGNGMLQFSNGVYVDIVSGTVEGSVRLG